MKFQNIAEDVKLGENAKIFNFVNLYGCEIGDNTKIGSFVEIQKGVKIGYNCKISSHSFICDGVTIEDDVFIGHNVTFIRVLYPIPVHLTKAYVFLGLSKGSFPVSEKCAEEFVSLPMFPELTQKQIEFVSHEIKRFLG